RVSSPIEATANPAVRGRERCGKGSGTAIFAHAAARLRRKAIRAPAVIPILAFDIETVPDTSGPRRLHALSPALSHVQVARMASQLRRQMVGHDFLPLHQHRIVAISCALRERDGFRLWSLGEPDEPEGQLIQRFFDGIEKFTPQLVSWNGGGFDLPVLNY